jgi:hypothetical protein
MEVNLYQQISSNGTKILPFILLFHIVWQINWHAAFNCHHHDIMGEQFITL